MILLLVRAGRVNLMYDMLVIGGGINGAGIARDAAGRGLKVLLCEKDDLANATSSSSSKLVHGGLRYLESYEFRLVRESLAEREILLNLAPHIVWPLRLVLPVEKGMRPSWMLRIGLFLYDHLAKRSFLPGTKTLNLRSCLQGASLKEHLVKGFEYSDCWADDARLVVLNAVDASERGAKIMTRTECVALNRLIALGSILGAGCMRLKWPICAIPNLPRMRMTYCGGDQNLACVSTQLNNRRWRLGH
jgi:glycerol-3-phosphate dehydrogenase